MLWWLPMQDLSTMEVSTAQTPQMSKRVSAAVLATRRPLALGRLLCQIWLACVHEA